LKIGSGGQYGVSHVKRGRNVTRALVEFLSIARLRDCHFYYLVNVFVGRVKYQIIINVKIRKTVETTDGIVVVRISMTNPLTQPRCTNFS